ncbi:MAG: phosphatidate cytidylyltransferase [Candidatus Tokpelaia sp. JSC085]|nr:MAG: phosphatidate cytidylyltransferase [Candidatus Tokpelaia sp. JSC085]
MLHLRLRILTGLFLSAFVLIVTWAGGLPFRIFSIIAGGVVFYEWNKLVLPLQDFLTRVYGWICYVIVCIILLFSYSLSIWIPVLAFLTGLLFLILLSRSHTGWIAGGFIYSCMFVFTLDMLRGNDSLGLSSVCFLYAVVWGTDIGAYFFGGTLGGPKLAPIWSPKKTWSGALGGAAVGIGAGICTAMLIMNASRATSSITFFILALFLSVISQIGDLGESWLKRRFHVKDSGAILPGHGGVLDRVDGLIPASIALYIIGSVVAGPGRPSNLFYFL